MVQTIKEQTNNTNPQLKTLIAYIYKYTAANRCRCVECESSPHINPSHVVRLGDNKFGIRNNPDADHLRQLIIEHRTSGHVPVFNPFNGLPHDDEAFKRWLHNSEAAFRLMALGTLLKLWKTPLEGLPLILAEVHKGELVTA